MRFGQDQSTTTIGNRAASWRIATSLLVLTIVLLTASPIATIAQGEGLSTAEVPAEAPAVVEPVAEQPTAVPVQPTSVPPTAVPPTAVPPTAVPPTAVPPTAIPTAVPTQVPPTAVPTQEPTAVPTEKVWVNTDALRVTDGVTTHTVQQGASATVSITYTVTTPRTSTTIYARLSGATDGWTITSPQLPDADPAATTAAWTEAATLQPGTAFTLPIVITAPATVAQDHAVSLHLWSVANGEKGQETGVAKTDLRIATITALAPPPTPTPTIESTAMPTQEPSVAPTPEQTVKSAKEPGATPAALSTEVPAKATASGTGSTLQLNGSSLKNDCRPDDGMSVENGVVQLRNSEVAVFICESTSAPVKVRVDSITEGWELSESGTEGSFGTGGSGSAHGSNKDGASFKIYLRPVNATVSEPLGILEVSIRTTSGGSDGTEVYADTLKAVLVSDSTPVPPTDEDLKLECEPEADSLVRAIETDVTCTISSSDMEDGTEVSISELEIASPIGVELIWNDAVVSSPHTVAPEDEVVSQDESFEFSFRLKQTVCSLTSVKVSIGTWFTFAGVTYEGPSQELNLTGDTVFDPLSVALTGTVDFGTMTWDGERYVSLNGDGTTSYSSVGSTTLTVSRHGDCGSPNSEKIQVTTTASTRQSGLVPEYEGASIPEGVAISSIDGAQLVVDPEFSGDAYVGLTFTLTPPEDAEPDTYSDMWVHVTVVNAD